ncbi:MAG TPA: hypothetical protein VIH14_00045 [Anaerolineales bacterium]
MDEKESILSEARSETRPQKKSVHVALRWVVLALVAFWLGALWIVFLFYDPTRKNLDSARLHMYVLKALSGVRGASLAVAADDYAGARLSLTQTSAALDTLSTLLGADHKDVLAAMQKSAAQALTDEKTDLKSAQPELDQLTKNLAQLEDNLFSNP